MSFRPYLLLSASPSVTSVTAVLPHSSGELLLLGTEGGHVFIVEVPGFRELEERNISLDQVANRLVISSWVVVHSLGYLDFTAQQLQHFNKDK